LFLPIDEGGQGLVQLQSRSAAFHLQFVQRLLNGSITSSWNVVAFKILENLVNLKMDRNLFFMDLSKLNLNELPMWNMFKVQREGHFESLYWLLEEPLIYGALFDLTHNDCTVHFLDLRKHFQNTVQWGV